MSETRRKWGDRRDGVWINKTDTMHLFMPILYPKRTGAEAVAHVDIDATALLAYVARRNAGQTGDKYTVFHAVVAALMKTVYHRPQFNRFYKGGRLYQKKELSAAFVAKKKFEDGAEEALMCFDCRPGENIDSIHDRIYKKLDKLRNRDKTDHATDTMAILCRLPRPIIYFVMWILRVLDFYGKLPKALNIDDPHFCSIWLTNLGSIKLNAEYHHLNEWGTNSVFVVVGEMHKQPIVDENDQVAIHTVLPISVTLDERITDGYYCAKTMRLLRYLLEHPEELEKPVEEAVDFE